MTEQTILLILLFCALAATLGLYILKAAKQTAYRGDERWQTVQLKAGVLADATNWLLIFLLLGAAIFADGEATFTLNRIGTLYMIYFGFRMPLPVPLLGHASTLVLSLAFCGLRFQSSSLSGFPSPRSRSQCASRFLLCAVFKERSQADA